MFIGSLVSVQSGQSYSLYIVIAPDIMDFPCCSVMQRGFQVGCRPRSCCWSAACVELFTLFDFEASFVVLLKSTTYCLVEISPSDKVVHSTIILALLTACDTANYCWVIRKLLCSRVSGVESKNGNAREQFPAESQFSMITFVHFAALQAHVLWSASLVIHNPGHQ